MDKLQAMSAEQLAEQYQYITEIKYTPKKIGKIYG